MPYSQFTLLGAKKAFSLQNTTNALFPDVSLLTPSDWLNETLRRTLSVAYVSEKARSESIVMPILIEMRSRNNDAFGIFSGAKLEVDKERGLNGECDFILGRSSQNFEIEAPIFCLVEAKENDIEIGIGQCVAQMIGANMLNEKENIKQESIYGCVTTGEDWLFMKLTQNDLIIDKKRYYLNKLEELLGVLQIIVQA